MLKELFSKSKEKNIDKNRSQSDVADLLPIGSIVLLKDGEKKANGDRYYAK
ncbi:hypothetical protein P261_02655 [Lachnospiraceae bacterium TWA4]|nr:hypothetical protein P261_02655 [Lachnospiraceae bacterium TWA4]